MPRLSDVVQGNGFSRRLNELMNQVAPARTAADVTMALHDIVALMHCNGAVFMSFARDDDSFQSYQYFVACKPYWCNQYIGQRWFMNDPALVYAHIHSEPIAGDDLPYTTKGQRTFRDRAREEGFASIAIVPAHSAGGRSRMGVLYLTSDDPSYFTAETIALAKMYLRAIASELLDWWIKKVRAQLQQEVAATQEELAWLRLSHQGLSTKEISRMVDMTPGALDQRFARLTMRFNAPSRAAAARIAYENGLLEI